jgi:hypothetical protein
MAARAGVMAAWKVTFANLACPSAFIRFEYPIALIGKVNPAAQAHRATTPSVTFFTEQQRRRHERNLQREGSQEIQMQDQTAVTQLLTAHEHDLLELRTEVEALKAGLKQLRANMLVSFKHAIMPNKSGPDGHAPVEEL